MNQVYRCLFTIVLFNAVIMPHGRLQAQLKAVNNIQRDSTMLVIGQPVERTLKGGEVHLYYISLQTGEFVRGLVDQRGITVRVRGFFPDGSKIRSFEGPSTGKRPFRFAAELPGIYTLELRGEDSAASGQYQLVIRQVQPMNERLTIVPGEKYVSPRLLALRKELEAGNKEALNMFWQEIKKNGAPLAEPLPGNDKYMLVTFLWRETFKIYNVLVAWEPFSAEHPDDYKMAHIDNSDIWFKTLRIPKGARFLYQLSPNETLSRAENAQRYATAQCDPLNPRRTPDNPVITRYEVFSIAELPGAPPQPWLVQQTHVPAGKIEKHRVKSTMLNNERNVAIYTPAGYEAHSTPYNLLLLFDGTTYLTSIPTPVILDNLIAAKKMAPVVAVLVDAASAGVRTQEFACNPAFADFVSKELLPWIHTRYNITQQPARVTIGGLSAGGLAASYVAMRNPQLFGNVLAQSGMFWWSPQKEEGEEAAWLPRQYIQGPKLPLKFYLEAGLFENDILQSTRRFRDVLQAKGYEVAYHEFAGGHDRLTWRGTLADALLFLMPY
jgi:enterochelin esterase-like enzyme